MRRPRRRALQGDVADFGVPVVTIMENRFHSTADDVGLRKVGVSWLGPFGFQRAYETRDIPLFVGDAYCHDARIGEWLRQHQLPNALCRRLELRREIVASVNAFNNKVGGHPEMFKVQAATVIVHSDE